MDAHRPGPLQVGICRGRQRVAPDDLQCKGRIDVVFKRERRQPGHHVSAAIGHRSEVVAVVAAQLEGAFQHHQAVGPVATPLCQIRFDQCGQPLVPAAGRVKAMGLHSMQCLLRLIKGIHPGEAECEAQQRNVFAHWPAAFEAARHGCAHALRCAMPVALQHQQQTMLKLIGCRVNQVSGVHRRRGFCQVRARLIGIAGCHGGQRHQQLRLGAQGCWPVFGQRECHVGLPQGLFQMAAQ